MSIAFFDLDRTLVAKNTGFLWVVSELRAGNLKIAYALEAVLWLTRYHLGHVDLDGPIRKAAQTLAGTDEQEMARRVATFFRDKVRPLYRPGAHKAIQHHRDEGARIFLLTTSSSYLSQNVCDDLALDGYLANHFVVSDAGRFTGEAQEPLCFGDGKLSHAQRCARELGVELKDCTFYTDSISDAPALHAVGHPVAVNPDRQLRDLARNEGWPIQDWGRP